MKKRDREGRGRSLYQCLNAKVRGEILQCSKGHEFPSNVTVRALARGAPLVFACCQNCEDYIEIGPPIPKSERGWIK